MKIKCKKCGEIIEGDKKGTYITCKCKAVAIDETPYYWRINGDQEDFDVIEEEKVINEEILKSEVSLDIIPIYKNKLYPTKEKMYHYACVIDSNEKGTIENLTKRMIKEIQNAFSSCDCIIALIILQNGKVIEVLK